MLDVELLKHFPGFTLDVRFQVAEGVVALLGPSGAGKTLTLSCLAGLAHPDGGRVVVRGRVLYDSVHGVDQPPRDRRLGVVFQRYALFPHLSVEGNIGFGIRRMPRKVRRARVDEMLERLGLTPVRHQHPAQLSVGQQQRVALGRALAIDPDLLLLDEPLSALDGPLRRTLRDELGRALHGFGKTAVVVTHDLPEACQLADQLVVYDQGRVLQCGPKSDVLARPASPAVARVLGIRNILEGEVLEASRDLVRLRWRGQELVGAGWSTSPDLPAPGSRATFFIRPEHARLMRKDRGREGPESNRQANLIPGRIVGEVDMGATVTLQFAVAGGEPGPAGYDLELEVSRLIHEKLCVHYDRSWMVSVQPSAVQLL